MSLADSWRKGSKPTKPHLKTALIGGDSWHRLHGAPRDKHGFRGRSCGTFWATPRSMETRRWTFSFGYTLVFECDSWLAPSGVKLDSDYSWTGHVYNFWILFLLRGDFFQCWKATWRSLGCLRVIICSFMPYWPTILGTFTCHNHSYLWRTCSIALM